MEICRAEAAARRVTVGLKSSPTPAEPQRCGPLRSAMDGDDSIEDVFTSNNLWKASSFTDDPATYESSLFAPLQLDGVLPPLTRRARLTAPSPLHQLRSPIRPQGLSRSSAAVARPRNLRVRSPP